MTQEIVTVWTYHDYIEAELAKIKLEGAGIDCFIAGDNFGAMQPYYLMASCIELCVRRQDSLRAEEILKDKQPPTEIFDSPEAEAEPIVSCPYCHSTNIERAKISALSLILSLLVGRVVPWGNNKWRCLNCWKKWKDKD